MILLTFLSIILIWLHVSSLRFMIRARSNKAVLEDASKIEDIMPDTREEAPAVSAPLIMSLGVILLLNLIEIGYFVFCVYLFNDYIIVTGSAILVGYSLYSMVRFLPKIKKFIRKPIKLLMERTEGYENILNMFMATVEILFCSYILFKIFFTF